MDALGKPQRKRAESLIDDLAAGNRHSSTHPLHRLKGWDSTKIDSRHLIVHQHREGVLHVGYVGAQHDYDAAHRRLSSLDLVAYFHTANDDDDEPYCEHCGDWGHSDEAHEKPCGLCGNLKRPDGSHPYNGEGPDDRCPNAPEPHDEKVERIHKSLDPSKYCGEGCQSGHAEDIAHGIMGHHTFHVEESDPVDKPDAGGRETVPHATSPYEERGYRRRPSGYEVRHPDKYGLCHYCRAPLKGGLADQMGDIGSPEHQEYLKGNQQGPTKYSSADVQYRVEYPRDHAGEGHAVASINGEDVGRLRWDYHSDTPTVIDMSVDEEHRRKGIGTGLFNKAKEHESGLQHSDVLTDDGRAFKQAAATGHTWISTKGEHPIDDTEHTRMRIPIEHVREGDLFRYDFQKNSDHPFMRAHGDAQPDPLYPKDYLEEGESAYALKTERGFAAHQPDGSWMDVYRPRTPKTAEKAPHWEHDHAWLPKDRIFGPGKGGLDPRLFGEDKVMHRNVEVSTLSDLGTVWDKYDLNWRNWARVYLAGSEASWWWGNNDFDCLIGIDHDMARRDVPDWEHKGDDEIDQMLTSELRQALNDEDYQPPWDDQVWHRTFFVNPNSWDIRKIKPYAAYDITRRLWAVEPVQAGPDWGPTQLPEELFSEGEGLVRQINAIEKLPSKQRTGRGAALWDYLHNDRRRAFSDEGEGVFDPGNAVWKYLDMHPTGALTRLLSMKREHLKRAQV